MSGVSIYPKKHRIDVPLFVRSTDRCLEACLTSLIHHSRIIFPQLPWGKTVDPNPKDAIWTTINTELLQSGGKIVQISPSIREVNKRMKAVRETYGIPLTLKPLEEDIADIRGLKDLIVRNIPFIAQIDSRYYHTRESVPSAYYHAVVVTGYDENMIYAHDPKARENYGFELPIFQKAWERKSNSSYLLVPIGSKINTKRPQKIIEEFEEECS